jgi:hypothetical protein
MTDPTPNVTINFNKTQTFTGPKAMFLCREYCSSVVKLVFVFRVSANNLRGRETLH